MYVPFRLLFSSTDVLTSNLMTRQASAPAPRAPSSRYDERPSDRGYSRRDDRDDRGYSRRDDRDDRDDRRDERRRTRSPSPVRRSERDLSEPRRSPSPRRSRSPDRERDARD